MKEILLSEYMPILALRGLTVFPQMLLHFDVGREKSVRAVDEAMKTNQKIFLVTQKEIGVDNPAQQDLYAIGTVARVKQVLKMPGDLVRILIEGECRAKITQWTPEDECLFGRIETVEELPYNETSPKLEALIRQSYQLFEQFIDLAPKNVQDSLVQVLGSTNPGYIADFIAQNSTAKYQDKQVALELLHPVKRLNYVNKMLAREIEILNLESQLQDKVQENVNRGQKEYYLREQMKAIHAELGDGDEESELEQYREKIRNLKLDEAVEEKLLKEVSRLEKQPSGSSEAAVIRNYLDVCIDLPWNKRTKEQVNVQKARKILDEDHFGLEKVKERILELLAVRQLAPNLPGPVICLVGPPGVGKTSVAMSIARSLNRNLARISLGGVHDEADIRGHRKTYIGAMPGRIINAIGQAGSKNALLLLDEIDKMGADYRGDPSAALLEVLDSEQNGTFRDHYLELPFDLSECMFITTANTLDTVPRALLDRMEVIELGSYTDEEKLHDRQKSSDGPRS